jgi:hypothetical protein
MSDYFEKMTFYIDNIYIILLVIYTKHTKGEKI